MAVSDRKKAKINSVVLESLHRLRIFCNNGNGNLVSGIGDSGLPRDLELALTCLEQCDGNICAYCSGIIYAIREASDTE
jgi:hypothetical protein